MAPERKKRSLMIAFQFPPFLGSSGIHRTLSFCRHLPEHGWEPMVLAPSIKAYPRTSDDLVKEVPKELIVHRSGALDACRHLAIRGRYLRWTALPDQWSTWWLSAVPHGLRMIKEHQPTVIWSTYPTATAHMIALTLHRRTGIPWIADFRDPMVYEAFPTDPLARRMRGWLEQRVMKYCSRAVFVSPGSAELYRSRYPDLPDSKFALIPNGYNEERFADLIVEERGSSKHNEPIVLVHSGLLEPSDRDPTAFFDALAHLHSDDVLQGGVLKVILRGSGSEDIYDKQIKERGISNIVTLEPRIDHGEALIEMMSADGLLIFQGTDCNRQIPGKIYEYIRSKKPLLALTDLVGDTAALLRSIGIDSIASIDRQDEIAKRLITFLKLVEHNQAPIADDEIIARYSRQQQTGELASLFDSVYNPKKSQ